MVKRAALKRRLLERDGFRCGVHVGGCGRKLTLQATTIDHIVPRNILRVNPEVFDQLANDESFLQPMCKDCNSARKQGRIEVEFTCECHRASFFIFLGKPELLVSYEKGYVTRRLRISAEESPDGTNLFVWGMTKKGTVGYKSDHFGGVFAYLPSSSDESDVIRTFRPISVQIHKDMKASSSKIPVVQVEHQDLRQIAKEAHPIYEAINDAGQRSIQSSVRLHSEAFLKFSRAIFLAGEQYSHLSSSVLGVPHHESSKSGVQVALKAIRATNRMMPDATQRIVRQMYLVSRKVKRGLATPGMQQMSAGTLAMNRFMGGMTWQCAKQVSELGPKNWIPT